MCLSAPPVDETNVKFIGVKPAAEKPADESPESPTNSEQETQVSEPDSQSTTLPVDSSDGGSFTPADVSSASIDVEIGCKTEEDAYEECPSIWTWRTCGLPIGAFFLAFLNSVASSVGYGFFLGYMGLDSYVVLSINALMKLPQVMLLPFGMLNDCLPIFGKHRKPYFVASWMLCGTALLAMSVRPLPEPYYCQLPDGTFDIMSPPCNPGIHAEKNWYLFPMLALVAGVQMGCVAGEGLLLEYSLHEPEETRGKMKAEFSMVTMGGALASSAFVGVFMNGKEYLGTFDWSLSFRSLMIVCLVIATCVIPLSLQCVYEPKKVQRPSCCAHVKSSWKLVKKKGLSTVLLFAFIMQFFSTVSTTAGPMVRSQWVGVKVLQQQMFMMGSMLVMMMATWVYKEYLLQISWRKAILFAVVGVTISDSIPSFLAIFGVVRNQYFFLGEDVLGAVPTTALALVLNLIVIEVAEPGREGLCYGLVGTVMHASQPISTAVSNQVFGLFQPNLSDPRNYLADTPSFRNTVAWSFVLAYGASMLGLCAIPLIPMQKAEAQRRKKEWSSSTTMAILVLGIPALCLPYGVAVLLLSSQPETACLRWIGGPGCV